MSTSTPGPPVIPPDPPFHDPDTCPFMPGDASGTLSCAALIGLVETTMQQVALLATATSATAKAIITTERRRADDAYNAHRFRVVAVTNVILSLLVLACLLVVLDATVDIGPFGHIYRRSQHQTAHAVTAIIRCVENHQDRLTNPVLPTLAGCP